MSFGNIASGIGGWASSAGHALGTGAETAANGWLTNRISGSFGSGIDSATSGALGDTTELSQKFMDELGSQLNNSVRFQAGNAALANAGTQASGLIGNSQDLVNAEVKSAQHNVKNMAQMA